MKIEVHNISDRNKKQQVLQQIKTFENRVKDEEHALLVDNSTSKRNGSVSANGAGPKVSAVSLNYEFLFCFIQILARLNVCMPILSIGR